MRIRCPLGLAMAGAVMLNLREPANAAQTLRLAGAAVDTDGKPVAGAVIRCYQQDGLGRWLRDWVNAELKHQTITDVKGAFEFRVSPLTTLLVARKPGLAATWSQYWNRWNVIRDMTEERLVLAPATNVCGVVVDEGGRPVADAEVWVSYACLQAQLAGELLHGACLSGKPGRDCFATLTTADGRFLLRGFPQNAALNLAVRKPGKVLREPEDEYVGPDTLRFRAGQQDIRLVVDPGARIRGVVLVPATGQVFPGVQLWSDGPGNQERVESGRDGTFCLADLAAGIHGVCTSFGMNAAPSWVADRVLVTVGTGQAVRDVKVAAIEGGFLEVAVVEKAGRQPVAGAQVMASKEAEYTATTGTKGIVRLRLPPGDRMSVFVFKEDYSPGWQLAKVQSGRTNRVKIELEPLRMVTGIVRDPSGAPAPGIPVSMCPGRASEECEVKTDARGRYELLWSWSERYIGKNCLVARDVARNLAASADLEPDTTTLDLRLEPGLVIGGQVKDVKGRPVSGATMRVFVWAGEQGHQFEHKLFRSDSLGRFLLTAMPPGRRYGLDVTAKGYGLARGDIEAKTKTNPIELPLFSLAIADRKLAGVVLDQDGRPAAGASVFTSEGGDDLKVRTDQRGRFQFDQLCEGQVRVFASFFTNSVRAYGNTWAEAGDTDVTIRLHVEPPGARGIHH